jgi:putative transcriptional regulator
MDIDKMFAIRRNEIEPGKGKLILSEPFLDDFYFGRSVVLLIEHDQDGSFGLIMNKPVPEKFNDLIKGFPDFDARVYLGGPVQPDHVFVLHTIGNEINGSLEVLDGLFWGGDLETIREKIRTGSVRPGQIRFYMGYAGWEPNQLNMELERNSWVVTNATSRKILATHHASMWSRFVSQLGSPYDLWKQFPVNPEMN